MKLPNKRKNDQPTSPASLFSKITKLTVQEKFSREHIQNPNYDERTLSLLTSLWPDKEDAALLQEMLNSEPEQLSIHPGAKGREDLLAKREIIWQEIGPDIRLVNRYMGEFLKDEFGITNPREPLPQNRIAITEKKSRGHLATYDPVFDYTTLGYSEKEKSESIFFNYAHEEFHRQDKSETKLDVDKDGSKITRLINANGAQIYIYKGETDENGKWQSDPKSEYTAVINEAFTEMETQAFMSYVLGKDPKILSGRRPNFAYADGIQICHKIMHITSMDSGALSQSDIFKELVRLKIEGHFGKFYQKLFSSFNQQEKKYLIHLLNLLATTPEFNPKTGRANEVYDAFLRSVNQLLSGKAEEKRSKTLST